MNILRTLILLICFVTSIKNYAVEDPSPSTHVIIGVSTEENDTSCDHPAFNTRIFLYNMTGLALGTTAYVVSSSITNNIASQIITTACLGALPPLIGITHEIYSCYKKR